MIKHYMTKYSADGKDYIESWLQFNILGKAYCWSKRIIEIV